MLNPGYLTNVTCSRHVDEAYTFPEATFRSTDEPLLQLHLHPARLYSLFKISLDIGYVQGFFPLASNFFGDGPERESHHHSDPIIHDLILNPVYLFPQWRQGQARIPAGQSVGFQFLAFWASSAPEF